LIININLLSKEKTLESTMEKEISKVEQFKGWSRPNLNFFEILGKVTTLHLEMSIFLRKCDNYTTFQMSRFWRKSDNFTTFSEKVITFKILEKVTTLEIYRFLRKSDNFTAFYAKVTTLIMSKFFKVTTLQLLRKSDNFCNI
jgi:hypothetical protein